MLLYACVINMAYSEGVAVSYNSNRAILDLSEVERIVGIRVSAPHTVNAYGNKIL